MLQNNTVTAFAVSEILRENQQGGDYLPPPPSHTHTPRLELILILNQRQ